MTYFISKSRDFLSFPMIFTFSSSLSVLPSVHPSVPHFCPEHISKSIWDINFKLHKWIDLIKEVCSVQEPLLYLQYFWSHCPLYIFFSGIFVRSISPKVWKLGTWNFTHIWNSLRRCAVHKIHYSVFSIFGVIALCTFLLWIFVRSIYRKV